MYCFFFIIFQPNNILLTAPYPHGDIKLCDFGFARTVNSGDDIRDIIGTPDYVGKSTNATIYIKKNEWTWQYCLDNKKSQ